ncbi:MAG: hypoxanthine phosphoribosyltransferase [Paludibacteraceae bacterium]|nr:hypoxanthine phosphoribosyltransferase [Paludibacteraceae bacterium]
MGNITIKDKTFRPYITAKQLEAIVDRVADEINRDIEGKKPIFLATLNGAFMFAADLLKRIKNTECQISFIKISSYSGTETTGNAKELIGLNEDISGRTIIILEDIIETGITMRNMLDKLAAHNPKEIRIATLFFKPQKLKVEGIAPDYVGMKAADEFIVGYGLDYDGRGRNLADIYIATE